jgi:hypothetical protein
MSCELTDDVDDDDGDDGDVDGVNGWIASEQHANRRSEPSERGRV